jgi:hypothetical protein
MAKTRDGEATLAQLIEKAWRDPAFKRRLMAEPEAVFREAGVTVHPDKKIRVVEETNSLEYFVLPPPPGGGGLSDIELDSAAGGVADTRGVCAQTYVAGIFKYGLYQCK